MADTGVFGDLGEPSPLCAPRPVKFRKYCALICTVLQCSSVL
jgi:hypothetical protein